MRRSVVGTVLAATLAAAPGGVPLAYQPPVPGEVVTAFEAPPTPYGSGHRGVDLAAAEGEAVLTAAVGRVAFAGPVAGTSWVSVDHPDGVRTSYGPLATVDVRVGQRVVGGARLGTVGSGHDRNRVVLHWSARLGPRGYLDPLELLVEGAGPWVPTLVGPGGWRATDVPSVPSYADWAGDHSWWGGVPGSPEAHGPGWAFSPNPNVVIGLAGFTTSSGDVAIDLGHLGYDAGAVHAFSYAGVAADGAPLPYGAEHTYRGVHTAALALRDQLRAVATSEPGRAVDLVGHSMGGVVALWYLFALHDPADPMLPPIAHVATIASPIDGADLATAVRDAQRNPLVDLLAGVLAGDLAAATTIDDLAPGSRLLEELDRRWRDAQADPWSSPLATGTRIATFGGSRDLVVPEHRTDLPGAPHVVLPGGHDDVRVTEASRIALRAFLADQPLPGESGGAGHVLSYPLSWLEGAVGDLLTPPVPVVGWP